MGSPSLGLIRIPSGKTQRNTLFPSPFSTPSHSKPMFCMASTTGRKASWCWSRAYFLETTQAILLVFVLNIALCSVEGMSPSPVGLLLKSCPT